MFGDRVIAIGASAGCVVLTGGPGRGTAAPSTALGGVGTAARRRIGPRNAAGWRA